MKFSELVRLLEAHGFSLVKGKGSIRYYGKGGWPALIRVDYHGAKEVPTGIGHSIEDCVYKAKWGMKEHVELLKEQGLPVPPIVKNPKIIVQNEDGLAA